MGATLYFADESGIRSDYHAGTTWAPQGSTPVVAVTGKRFLPNMISAVSAQGEFRFMMHEGAVTTAVFRERLGRPMLGVSGPVFLVLDGHPVRKGRLVHDFVRAQKESLELFYLPPYSSHLNSYGKAWAHMRRNVSMRPVQSKDEMKRVAVGALRRIRNLPALVKSLSLQPEFRYTTM